METSSSEDDLVIEESFSDEQLLDEETRCVQAMLISRLLRKCLDVQTLEKHKTLLDLPIVCKCCQNHAIDFRKDMFEKEEYVESIANRIRDGKCSCELVSYEHEVCKFYLVDVSCVTEDFLPVLYYLVEAGCDLDGKSREDKSFVPLMLALYHQNLEAAKFLVQQKVDVNIKDLPGDRRPLWFAALQNLSDFVELFLSVPGIDMNMKSSRGYPLLHYCLRNDSKYFEMLLEAGADPNIDDNHMSTALMISVSRDSVEAVKTLIRYGADVNQKNRRNEAPLTVGIYGGNAKIIEVLLDAGADSDFMGSPEADTPLLLSCFDGDIDIVKLLIKYHANVRKSNHLGYTPLHIAAWNGHVQCVKTLVEAGALHDIQTKDLNTPLALAAHGRHLSVVKELLPWGCNVNSADKDKDTAVHYAAYNGMTRTVELLHEYGANLNCRNRVSATPLWNAVYCGSVDTVKFLIKENVEMEVSSVGIDQHHQSDNVRFIYDVPRSPLWVAVDRCHYDIVMLLVSSGYDIHKEKWLFNSIFPDFFGNDSLRNTLIETCHNPFNLMTICRGLIRKQLGLGIHEKVNKLDIPVTLRDYLTLSDLHYKVNEVQEEEQNDFLPDAHDVFPMNM